MAHIGSVGSQLSSVPSQVCHFNAKLQESLYWAHTLSTVGFKSCIFTQEVIINTDWRVHYSGISEGYVSIQLFNVC